MSGESAEDVGAVVVFAGPSDVSEPTCYTSAQDISWRTTVGTVLMISLALVGTDSRPELRFENGEVMETAAARPPASFDDVLAYSVPLRPAGLRRGRATRTPLPVPDWDR